MMKEKQKSHGVQLLIRAVVRDPDGKIIDDSGEKPAKSFVIQFLEFFYGVFDAPDSVVATMTNGGENVIYQAAGTASVIFQVDAPINDSNFGVVIGTGDTPVTNEDYALETQLTEGIGAGNITHGVVVIEAVALVGANVDLEIKRAFTNQTGSTITVKEAGIYVQLVTLRHCIIRDVLAPVKNVPDKCTLTIYYTLRTTV